MFIERYLLIFILFNMCSFFLSIVKRNLRIYYFLVVPSEKEEEARQLINFEYI